MLEFHEWFDALTEGQYFVDFPHFKSHFDWVINLPQIKAYKASERYHKDWTFNYAPDAKVNHVSRH